MVPTIRKDDLEAALPFLREPSLWQVLLSKLKIPFCPSADQVGALFGTVIAVFLVMAGTWDVAAVRAGEPL